MKEPQSPVRDDTDLYETPDTEATENDVADLIAALVAALKPKVVVEVGTWKGYTSEKIGRELQKYGGVLHTYELRAELAREATERCKGLPVEVHNESGLTAETFPIELLFVDGTLDQRRQEYEHWKDSLTGIALIHDTVKYELELPECTGSISLRTPRGITLIQP